MIRKLDDAVIYTGSQLLKDTLLFYFEVFGTNYKTQQRIHSYTCFPAVYIVVGHVTPTFWGAHDLDLP